MPAAFFLSGRGRSGAVIVQAILCFLCGVGGGGGWAGSCSRPGGIPLYVREWPETAVALAASPQQPCPFSGGVAGIWTVLAALLLVVGVLLAGEEELTWREIVFKWHYCLFKCCPLNLLSLHCLYERNTYMMTLLIVDLYKYSA